MGKTGKLLLALGAVIIIAGGIWMVTSMNKPNDTTTPQSDQSSGNKSEPSSSDQSNPEAETAAVITFNGSTFEPASIEVKAGGSIKIVNDSLDVIEFASDPHPTHTINPELNTGDIEPSANATITVTKTGTWGYHNHYDPSNRGTIIVN